jgi:8-oxo-dGTP diphosphatase
LCGIAAYRPGYPSGGELEPGETPLEAAIRELREETGMQGRFLPTGRGVHGTPPGFLAYEEHSAGAKGLHMNFAFVAEVQSRVLSNCDEFDRVRWVTHGENVDCPENVRDLLPIALSVESPG